MRIAIYVRVSTQRQTQSQTIEEQLSRLQEYCQHQGWPLALENIFRDDGYSGSTFSRPALERLRDEAAKGNFDRVLITNPDRLARNYVHQMLLLEELEAAGCQVEFIERPMSRDPHDQLLLQIRGAVAEYERNLICERMRRGRLHKYQAGVLLPWTVPPYGYRLDPDHPRNPAGVRVEPSEAANVTFMYETYLKPGQTLWSLARQIEASGWLAPQGHKRWNQATIRWILTNPVYTGKVYAGRTRPRQANQRKSPLKPIGQRTKTLSAIPPQEWIEVTQVEALISQEQFEMVRTKLAHNQSYAARNNKKYQYLLRALVSCGKCHLACVGQTRAGGKYTYYACRGRRPLLYSGREEKCHARLIPSQALDELVGEDLIQVISQPALIEQALQRAQRGEWLPQELQARKHNLHKASASLDQQLERLTEAYLAGVVKLEEYKRRRQDVEQRQQSLEQQVQQLQASSQRQLELTKISQSIQDFCEKMQQGLTQAGFGQKRQLVELLIDRVIVSEEEVEIRYVVPTTSSSEQVRFCALRSNYTKAYSHH